MMNTFNRQPLPQPQRDTGLHSSGDDSNAAAEKVQRGGSQFADVSRYLSANRPQAQRLASKVGQNVVNAGNTARQTLGAAQKDFNSQVSGSKVPYNAELAQRAVNDPTSLYSYAQPAPAAAPTAGGKQKSNHKLATAANYLSQGGNPNKPQKKNAIDPLASYGPTGPITGVANPNDVAGFQQMLNADYAGPQSLDELSSYGTAADAEKKALAMGDQLNSPTGKMDLLKGLTGKGANSLDAALLGGGNQGILDQAAAQNTGLLGQAGLANDASIGTAQAADAETAATKQKIQDLLYGQGGALPTMQSQADQLNKFHGGGNRRMQNQQQKQQMQAKLEALNQLLGTKYNYQWKGK